jgi:putative chitinase
MPMDVLSVVTRVAPDADERYLEALRNGAPLFAQHGIDTPLRMAHFLAQALHETGGFAVLRENMNYSAARLVEVFGVNRHSAAITMTEALQLARNPEAIAERVYGLGNPRKAADLGNSQPGDGFRYRGNGVLQTTGRGNHARLGVPFGLDFEREPELVTAPEHALKPALREWNEGALNAAADRNDIRTITRTINGGFNGLEERQAWFDRVWPLLKSAGDPAEAWQASAADDDLRWLQQALNDLGADPQLGVDGRYGPRTRDAVKAFQRAAGLKPDGIAGPVTRSEIELRLATLR